MPTAYPDSPYGISILMDFFSGAPQYEIPVSVVNQAKALPVAWARLIFSWSRLEGPVGNFKWTPLDVNIQRFNSVGINVLFCLTSPPSFHKSQSWGGGYSYASASEMMSYAQSVATRYQTGSSNGVLSGIEIGNEDYNVSADIYHRGWWEAQALNLCHPAIKAIDPNMLCLMGGQLQTGITYVPRFQQELYTGNSGLGITGVGPNMDATNSHYYRGNPRDPNDPSYPGTFTIAQKLAAMHAVDADPKNGYPNRDFWVSEFGWAASKNGGGPNKLVTYAQQSQYDLEVVEAARASGFCSHAFIYTMDYADQNSIVLSSTKVTPAYTAYQAYIAANPPSSWPGFGSGSGGSASYKQTVLSDNPQAYYRLDELVGVTAVDSSSRNFTGTYASTGVTYDQAGLITGDSDTAVLFDGQSGQVNLTNGPFTRLWTGITLEAWIELSNVAFTTNVPLFASDVVGSTNGGINLSIGPGGANVLFSLASGATLGTVTGTFTFLASTRYYIAATWDGTTMAVYVNPTTTTPLATSAFSGTGLSTPPQFLAIGGNLQSGTNLPGLMDEAAIYKNTALSGTRVLAHYTAGTTGVAPAPTFGLVPTSLSPQSPGVTKTGNTYSLTVTLSETSGSIGTANWTSASSLTGVTFTPSSGALTPGGSVLITIANIPSLNGTFTFSGAEGETPIVATWTIAQSSPAGGFALFANGAGTASFDHFRVTGYPDPSLSLLQCAQAGASVANYNANLPNPETSVSMNTSLDGVNWTALAAPGAPIPGITTQPAATGDTFAVDTSANYTQTAQGTPTAWTWDTANKRVVAVGGTNGFLLSNALTGIGDVDMFVDMDEANSGGIVFHYQDAQDMYLLSIADASASASPNTLTLIKTVMGSVTPLVTYGTNVATASLTTAGKLATTTGGTGGTSTTAIGTATGYGELCALGTASAWPSLTSIPAPTGKGWLLDKNTLFNQALVAGNWTPLIKSKVSAGTLTASIFVRAFAYDTSALTYTFIGQCELDAQGWTTTAANYTFLATAIAEYSFNATQEVYYDCWLNVTANTSGAGSTITVNLATTGAAGVAGDMQMTTPGFTPASGTVTALASGAISFNRNTYHRIRVTMFGGVITAYFDGTQVLSYTDGSPLAIGQIGLRNNANTSRYYQFTVQPQGQFFTSMDQYVYAQLQLASTDPLNSPQVLDSATLVTGPSIGLGALIPGVAYQRTFVSKNFDDLKKQSDYFWYANNKKQVIFNPRTAYPAPWIVQASDASNSNLLVAGLGVEFSGDLYRNREVLQNVQATQTFTKQFVGDGKSTTWTLDYPVAVGTVPLISVSTSSTIPQSTGIKGVDVGKAYYYTPGGTGIAQDSSQPVLTGVQTLTVAYSGAFLTDVVVDNANPGDYPGTMSQADYAAIDGSSGVVEDVLDVSQLDVTKNMDVPTAQQYGGQLLQEYGMIGRTVTFRTQKAGLAPGQALSVFIPQYNIINMQALITQVDIAAQNGGSDGGPIYWFSVTACEGPVLADAVKLIGNVFG